MRLQQICFVIVLLKLVHKLGRLRIPHFYYIIALGRHHHRVVTVPGDLGDGRLLVLVQNRRDNVLVTKRLGAINDKSVPFFRLVAPNPRRSVFAPAEKAGRVVGIHDAVHHVCVRLELADLDGRALVKKVDAYGVVIAAGGQERAGSNDYWI